MIDRFSRWPEAVPLPNMAAQTVAAALIDGWVTRFGTRAVITIDQGKQFEASLFQAVSKFRGSKKIRTSPHHPASNGLIERWHSQNCYNLLQRRKTMARSIAYNTTRPSHMPERSSEMLSSWDSLRRIAENTWRISRKSRSYRRHGDLHHSSS